MNVHSLFYRLNLKHGGQQECTCEHLRVETRQNKQKQRHLGWNASYSVVHSAGTLDCLDKVSRLSQSALQTQLFYRHDCLSKLTKFIQLYRFAEQHCAAKPAQCYYENLSFESMQLFLRRGLRRLSSNRLAIYCVASCESNDRIHCNPIATSAQDQQNKA